MSGTTPCYICQGPMTDVRIDPRDGKPRPCGTCEEVIQESLDDWTIPDDEPMTELLPLEEFDRDS